MIISDPTKAVTQLSPLYSKLSLNICLFYIFYSQIFIRCATSIFSRGIIIQHNYFGIDCFSGFFPNPQDHVSFHQNVFVV